MITTTNITTGAKFQLESGLTIKIESIDKYDETTPRVNTVTDQNLKFSDTIEEVVLFLNDEKAIILNK